MTVANLLVYNIVHSNLSVGASLHSLWPGPGRQSTEGCQPLVVPGQYELHGSETAPDILYGLRRKQECIQSVKWVVCASLPVVVQVHNSLNKSGPIHNPHVNKWVAPPPPP